MLQELIIRNYAIIESLRLEFVPGFNVFTGETGAGKTIIIEALQLILGSRGSAEVVRRGADSATISAVFDIKAGSALKKFLEDKNLIHSDNPALIMRREIDSTGKSRCYCNDQPVTLAVLSQIGDFLIDIHGQYEHQVLLRSRNQLDILDGFGSLESLLEEVSGLHGLWKNATAELDSLKLSQSERDRKIDLYGFQTKEIDSARLQPGENEEIEKALPRIKNAEKLINLCDETYGLLYENENNALGSLGRIQKLVRNISEVSGTELKWAAELESAVSGLKDIAAELQAYRAKLDVNPDEYERLTERRDLIIKLRKKYGSSIEEILSYREKIGSELDSLAHNEENIKGLEKKISDTEEKLRSACGRLSAARRKSADKLEASIQKEMRDLGMPKAKFSIEITPDALSITSSGWDSVEFKFSPNVGEDLKPLKDIASGGEMSRTMLALKTTIGRSDHIPTMVYDEIDSGVSGPMGQVIGQKLSGLSGTHQIICITHLAQIASFAARHFHIDKTVRSGRTSTTVSLLEDRNRRIDEISRMLSGAGITQVTRQHAEEMLSQAKND